MKVIKSIWIRGYKDQRLAERDLKAAGVDPAAGEWNFALGIHGWSGVFDIDDVRWTRLRDIAIRSGIEPLIGERAEYSEAEMNAAELLEFHVTVESKGDTGPEYGNDYDFSRACPLCLSGAKLIPPFRIAVKDLPNKKPVAETHAGEILVSGSLEIALSKLPDSSQWLIPVEDCQTHRQLPWRAIHPSVELPRWHTSTRGMKHQMSLGPPWDTCPKCGRDCHGPKIGEAVQLIYSRSAITREGETWPNAGSPVPDVAGTWELMGPGTRQVPNATRQIAQPYVVVSQRVARILREYAGEYVVLSPITLLP